LSVSSLAGRVAITTGGGSGIGRGCAISLGRAGAQVVVNDVDAASAEQTVATTRSKTTDGRFGDDSVPRTPIGGCGWGQYIRKPPLTLIVAPVM